MRSPFKITYMMMRKLIAKRKLRKAVKSVNNYKIHSNIPQITVFKSMIQAACKVNLPSINYKTLNHLFEIQES